MSFYSGSLAEHWGLGGLEVLGSLREGTGALRVSLKLGGQVQAQPGSGL